MAKKKLLFAAVIVGGLAALLMGLFAKQQSDKVGDALGEQREVVKAARDIPPNTPLTPDLVVTAPVPLKFLPPNPIFKADLDIYIGTPVAVNIQAGSMVLTSDFAVAEVSRDLSSKIPGGERALSIPVDAISGLSGLLVPGDRVDILGTFPVSDKEQSVVDAKGEEAMGFVTMTLLQNVTLLAVGQQVSEVAKSGGESSQNMYNTVTLSVTVEEAELLTITQTRGKMQLLLRNREDIDVIPVTKRTLREVLLELEVMRVQREARVKKVVRAKAKDPGIIITSGSGK